MADGAVGSNGDEVALPEPAVALDSPSGRLLAWVDRRRWWLFALVVLLHAAAYNGQWRVSPDSALYSELGRNIADGRGFTYHGEPHRWVEPGLPFTIGYSFRWFGYDNFHPLMIAMVTCSALALMLTYALVKLHAGRPTAALVTVMLGLSETFFRYGFHLFNDMPFLVSVLAFLLGYDLIFRDTRSIFPWLMVMCSTWFMVAFRPAYITFVGAVLLACAWHVLRGPGRLKHVVIAIVVAGSVFMFKNILDPRRGPPGVTGGGGTANYRESMLKSLLGERLGFAAKRMVTEYVPMLLEETTPEAVFGMQLGPGVSSVVAIGVIASGLVLVRRRVLWGAWVAATLAQMAFWLPRERYFLPILPLLLYGLWASGNWLSRRLPVKWRGVVPVAVVVLLVVPNVVYIGKFIREQRREPFLAHYEKGQVLETKRLAEKLGAEFAPDATIIAEHGRELSYFSGRRVTDPLTARRTPPTDAEYAKLREQLAAEPWVFVVLPGKKTEELIQRLDGELLGTAGVSEGELTVYRAKFTVPRATTRP